MNQQGNAVEDVVYISAGKKEVTVAMAENAKLTIDQFCEKVVNARLEYQNLENRLTPHASPNKGSTSPAVKAHQKEVKGKEKDLKDKDKDKDKGKEKDDKSASPLISIFKSKGSESEPTTPTGSARNSARLSPKEPTARRSSSYSAKEPASRKGSAASPESKPSRLSSVFSFGGGSDKEKNDKKK